MASVDTGTVLPSHQGSWLVGFLASNNTTRLSVSRLFEHHARGGGRVTISIKLFRSLPVSPIALLAQCVRTTTFALDIRITHQNQWRT